MVIREAVKGDLPFVYAIEKDVMTMSWSLSSFESALNSETSLFLVLTEQEKIEGFMILYLMPPEAELPDIVIARDNQHCGLGRKLLIRGIEILKEKNISDLYLEVREGNIPARSLYKSLGFTENGIRKNFYVKPVENAVCMHLSM